jgi:predicted metal-dependent hydrolase
VSRLQSSLLFVRHPRARRYVIRVQSDGSVRVTVPRWGSERRAHDFVRQQQAWIERQRRRLEERRNHARAECPAETAALRSRAAKELPDELRRLAALNGLTVSRVSVRNQRSRWGSCSRKGHICLNWRLMLMPGFVREYVLIHELMHLKRLDHSPAFWRQVIAACPRCAEARKWLCAHNDVLMMDPGVAVQFRDDEERASNHPMRGWWSEPYRLRTT